MRNVGTTDALATAAYPRTVHHGNGVAMTAAHAIGIVGWVAIAALPWHRGLGRHDPLVDHWASVYGWSPPR
jgi:hypothetical protein